MKGSRNAYKSHSLRNKSLAPWLLHMSQVVSEHDRQTACTSFLGLPHLLVTLR